VSDAAPLHVLASLRGQAVNAARRELALHQQERAELREALAGLRRRRQALEARQGALRRQFAEARALADLCRLEHELSAVGRALAAALCAEAEAAGRLAAVEQRAERAEAALRDHLGSRSALTHVIERALVRLERQGERRREEDADDVMRSRPRR
jgi:hypothetical protein